MTLKKLINETIKNIEESTSSFLIGGIIGLDPINYIAGVFSRDDYYKTLTHELFNQTKYIITTIPGILLGLNIIVDLPKVGIGIASGSFILNLYGNQIRRKKYKKVIDHISNGNYREKAFNYINKIEIKEPNFVITDLDYSTKSPYNMFQLRPNNQISEISLQKRMILLLQNFNQKKEDIDKCTLNNICNSYLFLKNKIS